MSDTPRTDAEVFQIQDCNGQLRNVITTQFARQLERELSGVLRLRPTRDDIRKLEGESEARRQSLAFMINDNRKLRAENTHLREIAARALAITKTWNVDYEEVEKLEESLDVIRGIQP